MVKDLLEGLLEYKSQMEYRNSDFNADKVKQYEAVRIILANKYRDGSLFGPTEIPAYTEEDNKEDYTRSCEKFKAQIRRGYTRVQEKIKHLRQKFSNAVTSGTRSGSGKMVMEFYDVMVKIWGGSPATEPLQFGVQSAEKEDEEGWEINDFNTTLSDEIEESSRISDSSHHESIAECENTFSEKEKHEAMRGKRKMNVVPTLIDNKRRHMERQLSASQRDKILMQESKDEQQFRKEISNSLKESNLLFAESLKAISASMTAIASSIQKSCESSQHIRPPYPSDRMQSTNLMPQFQQGINTSNYIFPPDMSGQSFYIPHVESNGEPLQPHQHQY